jgi:heme-degrading monooxygenase HmoA
MHARIAYFEGGGPSSMEEGRRITEERFLPMLREMSGYSGHLQLGNLESGRAMVVTLFASEDDLRTGDQKLEEMSPPPEFGDVRRTGLERYEVAIHDVEQDAQAARVSRLEGSPDRLDTGIRNAQENILPQARRIEGNRGALGFVDRQSGTTLIITLWESMDALQRSEEQANSLRQQSADAGGQTIASVDRYQVVTMQVPVGARR